MKLISEIGINYNGNFNLIEEMIRLSSLGGADFAKFQLYDSQKIFGDSSRKKYEFTFDQVKEIKSICDYYEIDFLASVFDEEKLEWCEDIQVNKYKIASRTLLNDQQLCKKIINTNKEIYASLGFWNKSKLPFIEKNIKYFNCISKYPTSVKDLKKLRKYDEFIIGYSDHSYGISFSLYQITLGARIIEKHFTLNKSDIGNDHIGSMNYDELMKLKEIGSELYKLKKHLDA